MCTAMVWRNKNTYFGRTLDIEKSYGEKLVVTPRHFPLQFRNGKIIENHYAFIGMAVMGDHTPLYFDAMNEKGLAMAALNFPEYACYFPEQKGMQNIAPFEVMKWVLAQCATCEEAVETMKNMNLTDVPFSALQPLTPLHWMIADKEKTFVAESVEDGMHIYENKVDVMTNSPPFPYHMMHLCDYMHLSPLPPENHFETVPLKPYSRGMGALGLPGDWSSASRFVRAAYVKAWGICGEDESGLVNQFFRMMGAVEHPRGCVRLDDGRYQITAYTCCMNTSSGVYYYRTYENSCISSVDMHHCNLEGSYPYMFPIADKMIINSQN